MTMQTTHVTPPELRPVVSDPQRAFERWGIAVFLVAVVVLVAVIVAWLGGPFVYVLDDAAIHLSMADKLVDNGTWGVSAGSYESASSSPLWTLLVAGGLLLTPVGEEWVPLALNVAAGVAALVLLGRSQAVLVPGRRRLFDMAVVGALVVLALFLPGLAVVGMEHTLHIALVLGALILLERPAGHGGEPGGLPRWLPYVLLALATLTRIETAFVGAGIVAGMLVEAWRTGHGLTTWRYRALGVTVAVALPLAGFALTNTALGGGLLPNSVLAKGNGIGIDQSGGVSPTEILARLGRDPLLTALVGLAVAYVALTWNRPVRHRLAAVTLIVAAVLHAGMADMGWFERYQAYLIAIGVYLALGVIGELPSALRRQGLAALLVATALFTPAKVSLLLDAHRWADEMYRHQYQAGLFFDRYYDGQPIATSQLGYISLFHDGPLTDFGGLGDYEVLTRKPETAQERSALWAELADERGFRVVAEHATSQSIIPDTWVLVGQFQSEGEYVGYSRNLQFWATTPDEVPTLEAHLRAFEPELPDRMTLQINSWAGLQAAGVDEREGAQRVG